MPFSLRKFRRSKEKYSANRTKRITSALGKRSLVLVGLMGAGKTAIGKRLATELDLPFTDADNEIETAAQKTISEIFADHGEEYFRTGEQKVIQRLLQNGPQVLATGGGAYMNEQTRQDINTYGISIWLKANFDVLMSRVSRRDHRPLLQNDNPEEVMRSLIEERYPVYELADITVVSRDGPHEVIVSEILSKLASYVGEAR